MAASQAVPEAPDDDTLVGGARGIREVGALPDRAVASR